MLFCLEPRSFRSAARARFPPRLLRFQRLAEELFHPRQGPVAVGELAPLRLRGHAQHALAVDPPRQPLAHIGQVTCAQWNTAATSTSATSAAAIASRCRA